jgi:hypothetical protein
MIEMVINMLSEINPSHKYKYFIHGSYRRKVNNKVLKVKGELLEK